jgi:hypothetical protein
VRKSRQSRSPDGGKPSHANDFVADFLSDLRANYDFLGTAEVANNRFKGSWPIARRGGTGGNDDENGFLSWFGKRIRTAETRRPYRRSCSRPVIEALEDRTVLSLFTPSPSTFAGLSVFPLVDRGTGLPPEAP